MGLIDRFCNKEGMTGDLEDEESGLWSARKFEGNRKGLCQGGNDWRVGGEVNNQVFDVPENIGETNRASVIVGMSREISGSRGEKPHLWWPEKIG